MESPMKERAKNYSIKCTLTDLRSGEVIDWFEDYEEEKHYAEMEFLDLSNAHTTFNY